MASEFALTIDEYPFEILADDTCLIYWPEHEQYAELCRLRLADHKEKQDNLKCKSISGAIGVDESHEQTVAECLYLVAIAEQTAYIPDDSFDGPDRWPETMPFYRSAKTSYLTLHVAMIDSPGCRNVPIISFETGDGAFEYKMETGKEYLSFFPLLWKNDPNFIILVEKDPTTILSRIQKHHPGVKTIAFENYRMPHPRSPDLLAVSPYYYFCGKVTMIVLCFNDNGLNTEARSEMEVDVGDRSKWDTEEAHLRRAPFIVQNDWYYDENDHLCFKPGSERLQFPYVKTIAVEIDTSFTIGEIKSAIQICGGFQTVKLGMEARSPHQCRPNGALMFEIAPGVVHYDGYHSIGNDKWWERCTRWADDSVIYDHTHFPFYHHPCYEYLPFMYAVSVQEELIPAAFPTSEVEHEHAHYGVGSDHAEKTDTSSEKTDTAEELDKAAEAEDGNQEYTVQEIEDWRYQKRHRRRSSKWQKSSSISDLSEVEFLVRWQGYSRDSNTWEPGSSLDDTASLQIFADARGLELPCNP